MLYVLGYELNEKELKELFILLQNNPNTVIQLQIISIFLHITFSLKQISDPWKFSTLLTPSKQQDSGRIQESRELGHHATLWRILSFIFLFFICTL